jgi:hypothetical protein
VEEKLNFSYAAHREWTYISNLESCLVITQKVKRTASIWSILSTSSNLLKRHRSSGQRLRHKNLSNIYLFVTATKLETIFISAHRLMADQVLQYYIIFD